MPVRRMATALRRNGRAAAEPFPRLRVIQDRVRRVDGVLRRAVPCSEACQCSMILALAWASPSMSRSSSPVGGLPLATPGTVTGFAALDVIPAGAAAGG